MRLPRVRSGRLILTMLATVAVALLSTAPALAQSSWWHLSSGARPTYLRAGVATNERQQVTVKATGGEFVLADMTAQEVKEEEFFNSKGEPKFVELPFDASAATVQSALEPLYGSGQVKVTGGPGDTTGSSPYLFEFAGAREDQPVKLINTQIPAEFHPLQGEVSSSELAKGKPDGEIVVTAENLGDRSVAASESPVHISDVLPSGMTAVGITGTAPFPGGIINARNFMPCSLSTLSCELNEDLAPYAQIEMRIAVAVKADAHSDEGNAVSVSGGETEAATITRAVQISDQQTPFGLQEYELTNEEEGGNSSTQAGAHPFQQTTSVTLNQLADTGELAGDRAIVSPAALPKDLNFIWPAGLIGNPTVIAQCTIGQFLRVKEGRNECPAQTAVGVATVTVNEPGIVRGALSFTVPLFNVEPAAGEPARFGFFVTEGNAPVLIDTAVRTGDDYGVTVSSHSITQTAAFLSATVTVWGVPGDPRHDTSRGWGCLEVASGAEHHAPCNTQEESHPRPLLSLPTSCSGPLESSVQGDSWSSPGQLERLAGYQMPALQGCNRLPFDPSITTTPDVHSGSSPTGLTVDVHNPQEASLSAAGLAESDVKDITVALPAGIATNPAGADGLEACSEAQIGFQGNTQNETSLFTAGLPAPAGEPAQPFCPEASKIGTATIHTPLLPNALEGAVYLAQQNANPFASLIAMYIVAQDPVSGVLIKLAGEVSLDPSTGQLTTRIKNSPEASFEDAELHFFGGDRAPLSTPVRCGSYTTNASFAPWSGTEAVGSDSSFVISSGPNGGPCDNPPPFAPSLVGGMTNIQAGAFSSLTTTISRADGNQDIHTVQLHMPPGLSGILSGVALCAEAQANAGSCGHQSLIGHTIVSVGVGGDPFSVTGGQVFLTEGYGDAPFGLSIVNPAKAGPFDLGVVVVRAKVEVDPHTAGLTISTDDSGPYAIPRILDGIPLQIQHVNVTIDRPGFTFNPTNCGASAITGTITSAEGVSGAVSEPFQATNCATLRFAPQFTVAASGKTSKAAGASLAVKLSYPSAPFGSYANIARVKVSLPKQLPSRLTTLQKACVAAVFDANPASCPKESIVGHAKVITPLLPVALTGPAYFVSHGGEAFPDLTIVLQGYGVTIDLVGSTSIKSGVTTSTFKATPDVPFSSFELTLPQGRFSALTANANLCKSKLAMPSEFLAQNGAVIKRSTKIAITGCPKRLSKKQQLVKALKTCQKKNGTRRKACERQVRRRYGVSKKDEKHSTTRK